MHTLLNLEDVFRILRSHHQFQDVYKRQRLNIRKVIENYNAVSTLNSHLFLLFLK